MDTPFLGMVQYFAFDWSPRGFIDCNGALLSIAQNTALFSLLGTMYGGNGIQTFAVPDLRGRSVVGMGNQWTQGEIFGTPTATMLTSNMPSHTHTVPTVQMGAFNGSGRGGDSNDPTSCYASIPGDSGMMYTATADSNAYLGAPTATVSISGSSTPFNVQNPYLAVHASIATQGIFPSRN